MNSVLSKFRRPTELNYGEPSREIGIRNDLPGRAHYPIHRPQNSSLSASRGVAYANRPKLLGRKIAGRIYRYPMICVANMATCMDKGEPINLLIPTWPKAGS